jgi:hypothetical protein
MTMRTRILRRRVLVLAVAVLALAAGGTAVAGHMTSGVKSYTGCTYTTSGLIVNVKEGDSPLLPCQAHLGQKEIHLSGGDITAVNVGPGLTGGGVNGAVTVGLNAQQSLPACANGQVPKWSGTAWACAADNDTQYSAGTGLDLNGTTFSIEPDYRVKNTPDCSSGQFATGFDSGGSIQCSTPSAAITAFSSPQASFEGGVGIPDDGAFHVFASVNVPAGNYFVTAKGRIISAGNVDDFSATECRIQSGSIVYDSMRWGSVPIDDNPSTTLALAGLGASSGGTIQLACAADSGADGVGLANGRLVVLKVG